MLKSEVEKLTSRHIGRVLERLEDVNTSTIVKDTVKREFWLLSDDIKSELDKSTEQENNVWMDQATQED